jgi:hypothetical protein
MHRGGLQGLERLIRKYTEIIMQIRRRDNPSSHRFAQMTIGMWISVTGSADR